MPTRLVTGIGASVALLCLGTTLVLGRPSIGSACNSEKCTYFLANGKSVDGTCGSSKTDHKHCYCFDNSDRKLKQAQAGCSEHAR